MTRLSWHTTMNAKFYAVLQELFRAGVIHDSETDKSSKAITNAMQAMREYKEGKQ